MALVSFSFANLQSSVEQTKNKFITERIIERFWNKDYAIWRTEEEHKKSILNRLGWLNSIQLMQESIATLKAFAEETKNAGFTNVIVLGMGGSSLCPDVCRATFGSANGFPKLFVVDSTNPTSVLRIEKQINLSSTLFIVASKSGGTTETNMFYQYFYDRVASVKQNPGENFVAVTDADTKMEQIAKDKKFRKIFINPTDIGGRYSALSYFGLVPMALIGMDIEKILESATAMQLLSKNTVENNPAAQIGIMMGEAYNAGRDKMTFILSNEISTFAYWAEQLIAESTGKEGKGIVPIEGEVFDIAKYSNDRFFVFLQLEKDRSHFASMQKQLEGKQIPYVVIEIQNKYELGFQFFLWEFATATSAVVMNINPFDEPNVKESKDNTVWVISEYKFSGKLPQNPEVISDNNFTLFAQPKYSSIIKKNNVKETLHYHFSGKKGYDYVGILAYVDQNDVNMNLLYQLREKITKQFGIAVTVGFGPRYLHSTGQLHKGGKPNGIFLLITANEPNDAQIPREVFSFEILKNAQALGDYQSFANREYRLLQLHINGEIEAGLKKLNELF